SARFSAVAVSSAWPRRSGATLPFVPVEFCEFLAGQPFVVVASQDQRGRVWGSLVVGGPGFARSLDDRRVLLAGAPAPGGPLRAALQRPGARVGVLAIEFDTRIRIRLNGVAEAGRDSGHHPGGVRELPEVHPAPADGGGPRHFAAASDPG